MTESTKHQAILFKTKKVALSERRTFFSTSTKWLFIASVPKRPQNNWVTFRIRSRSELSRLQKELQCVFHSASAVSIKPGLKSNIKARGALEPQNLLFRGCQAAYPLATFIKSPWKNCPQKCSPLSECLDVIVFQPPACRRLRQASRVCERVHGHGGNCPSEETWV